MGNGEPVGIVSDLWRYPVKSFGGERVRAAFVGPFGLHGDRRHAIVNQEGEPMTARRNHALLGYRARYSDPEAADGLEITTEDSEARGWDDPGFAASLVEQFGEGITLARSLTGVHDAAPIHMISTASLVASAEWTPGEEMDVRRFRANVVVDIDDADPFTEAAWPGLRLEAGDDGPELFVVSPTERCAVTTFDPDTQERDNRVLAGLTADLENLFGVYAQVTRSGWLRVGDELRIVAGGS